MLFLCVLFVCLFAVLAVICYQCYVAIATCALVDVLAPPITLLLERHFGMTNNP